MHTFAAATNIEKNANNSYANTHTHVQTGGKGERGIHRHNFYVTHNFYVNMMAMADGPHRSPCHPVTPPRQPSHTPQSPPSPALPPIEPNFEPILRLWLIGKEHSKHPNPDSTASLGHPSHTPLLQQPISKKNTSNSYFNTHTHTCRPVEKERGGYHHSFYVNRMAMAYGPIDPVSFRHTTC